MWWYAGDLCVVCVVVCTVVCTVVCMVVCMCFFSTVGWRRNVLGGGGFQFVGIKRHRSKARKTYCFLFFLQPIAHSYFKSVLHCCWKNLKM